MLVLKKNREREPPFYLHRLLQLDRPSSDLVIYFNCKYSSDLFTHIHIGFARRMMCRNARDYPEVSVLSGDPYLLDSRFLPLFH